jgi:hypothetical protein
MPAADDAIEDWGAGLLTALGAERRAKAAARRVHVVNAERARNHDAFCRELMAADTCADAQEWIKDPKTNLGEMDRRGSQRLVQRWVALGALRIMACKIDSYGDEGQNTGHLVIELPKEVGAREKLFKALARQAESQGFDGDPDDGQQYMYLKLD